MSLLTFLKRVSEKQLVLWGILIILVIAFYSAITTNTKVVGAINECNAYWEAQLQKVCPAALNGGYSVPTNSSVVWSLPTKPG